MNKKPYTLYGYPLRIIHIGDMHTSFSSFVGIVPSPGGGYFCRRIFPRTARGFYALRAAARGQAFRLTFKIRIMKKSYSFLPALCCLFALTLGSCGLGSSSKQTKAAQQAVPSACLEVDSLLQQAETLAGQPVSVEGVCTHICQHGGGKIFLMGSDDTRTIRIDASDALGKFKPETVNSLVRVTGTLEEQRIDESFLSQWEAEVKAATAQEHGEGGAGCSSDQKARGEAPVNSVQERIDNFRKRIAQRRAAEGKDYLSFYSVRADSYEIL